MVQYLFAHGGEIHDSTIESSAHALAWYIQIPLFIFIMVGVYSLLQLLIKQKSTLYLVIAFILLIVGFSTYELAPAISVMSITIGMAMTLLLTLLGLGNNSPAKHQTNKKS